jgi:hypothetical protein
MPKSLSKKECDEFLKKCKKGTCKNPETGRKIKVDGPTYKKILNKCSGKKSKKSSTKKYKLDCEKWKKGWISGEKVNPETRRKIKQDGPKYKELVKKCGDPYVKKVVSSKRSPPKSDDQFVFEENLKFILEPDEEESLQTRLEQLKKKKNAFKFKAELDSIQKNLEYMEQVSQEKRRKIKEALEKRMDVLANKL